jgi:endonuclease/exonuclease/phosphatase family metal-dependent hydrolase
VAGLLVRTWNVFHGNTVPPGRRAHLRDMLRLALDDDPDVLCLQELPAWSLRLLDRWTHRRVATERARPSVFVALPIPSHLGRALTSAHHGLLRSAFAGQGIATVLADRLELRAEQTLVLNPTSFRAERVRTLELPTATARVWAGERRVAQASVLAQGERELVLVNFHATSCDDRRLAAAEVERLAAWATELAGQRPVVLAGDFNLEHGRSDALAQLERAGFSAAGEGIDHVLVRGLEVERAEAAWPAERRRRGKVLLSDHAPVDTVLAW